MMLKWIYDESWQIYIYIFIAVQIWSMYSTSKMSLLENTVIWHHWDTDYWWFQICLLHIWPECTSMQYIQDLNCLYFIHIHNEDFHHKHLVSTINTIPPRPHPLYIYVWKLNQTLLELELTNFCSSLDRIWTNTIDTLSTNRLALCPAP